MTTEGPNEFCEGPDQGRECCEHCGGGQGPSHPWTFVQLTSPPFLTEAAPEVRDHGGEGGSATLGEW